MDSVFLLPVAILGAIMGSFAMVVAERSFTGEAWHTGRSKCNSCARELSTPDLIPIFSWLFLRGRCRTCGSRVPGAYAFFELVFAAAFSGAYLMHGISLSFAFLIAAISMLGIIVRYDLRHMVIPPLFSSIFLVLSLSYSFSVNLYSPSLGIIFMQAGAIGLFLFFIHVLSRGRAMGLGDTPLVLALSLLVGMNALSGLLFSFWVGGVIGIFILLSRPRGHRIGVEVPFAPFLAAGFLIALFSGWNIFTLAFPL